MTATRRAADGRAVAFAVLRRVFEEGAWADRALHAEARRSGLDPREHALATHLAFGAVQRRATIDWLIERLAGRPVSRLDPATLAALRLGLFQLVWSDRIPSHAAVDASVELAKGASPAGARLVNAVLRRAAREARSHLDELDDADPARAALTHSHPEWMARAWWETFGPSEARALLAAGNLPPETALRVNTLRAQPDPVAASLPVRARRDPHVPEALVLEGPFDAFGHPGWEGGEFMPQSRASQAVARLLGPAPGERVLDLCAAPGAKTTHLAALMATRGSVVAVERHPGRAQALRRTAERMGAENVEVRVGDAAAVDEPDGFDRVLVDPPCSDLGTLAARPDARWRKGPGDPERLAREQARILRAGARAVRGGGVLVYSTCTISEPENERLLSAFLSDRPDFEPDDLRADRPAWQHPRVPRYLQTLPHRDRTDGFFIARLRRRP
jgi:16S rRNA (cytosine967-C5)-methyltransferase